MVVLVVVHSVWGGPHVPHQNLEICELMQAKCKLYFGQEKVNGQQGAHFFYMKHGSHFTPQP